MTYRDLILTKIEKNSNIINTLQAAVSRGDEETYNNAVELMKEELQSMYTLIKNEEQD